MVGKAGRQVCWNAMWRALVRQLVDNVATESLLVPRRASVCVADGDKAKNGNCETAEWLRQQQRQLKDPLCCWRARAK